MATWPIRLGPFELQDLAGQGAMGLVWRGRHVALDKPVAIKILRAEVATDRSFRRGFELEIEAVARLRHPGIVTLLDLGEVTAEAAATSQRKLAAGAPWVAMEYALEGTLGDSPPAQSWGELRERLTALLDALAHAHARGVIHRDLKPTNVLLTRDSNGRQVTRLTDFGIAHALYRPDPGERFATAGTPAYMAPEQIQGYSREVGPWTDLYALGCLAWWMTCRATPYRRNKREELLRAHLHDELPAFEPRVEVPAGFSAWLQGLLDKRPHCRFQRAADAKAVLFELGGQDEGGAGLWVSDEAATIDMESAASSATQVLNEFAVTLPETRPLSEAALDGTAGSTHGPERRADADPGQGESESQPESHLPSRALVPNIWHAQQLLSSDWRAHEPGGQPVVTPGAGLGLYGVRSLPVIGRKEERNTLWGTWLRSVEDRSVNIAVVKGYAGVGKSCLVEWLVDRVHELGAQVLRAQFAEMGVRALEHAVSRLLRCDGMKPRAVEAHLLKYCAERAWGRGEGAEHTAFALADFVNEPAKAEQVEANVTRRYATIATLLKHIGRSRPVCLWLDDAHVGADGIRLAEYLRTQLVDTPSLVVITVRDDLLSTRPVERELLAALETRPETTTTHVGPLPEADHEHLIQVSLGLDERLVTEVARRTAGNPLFAVQLVGDWVQRGVLEPRNDGYVLKAGEKAELPDDLHSLWREKLTALLPGESDRTALEIAAALGGEIDPAEWDLVCRAAGVERTVTVKELVSRQLAVRRQRLWSFVHGMLRESVERLAREAQRWEHHHAACAAILSRTDYGQPGIARRLTRHLIEAGRYEEALKVLRRAIEEALGSGNLDERLELVRQQEAALTALNTPRADKAWGEVGLTRARISVWMGNLEEAENQVREVERFAAEHGVSTLEPYIAAVTGLLALRQGIPDDAYNQLTYAIERLEHQGERTALNECRLNLALAQLQRGELTAAATTVREVERHARSTTERYQRGQAQYLLGVIHRQLGELQEAEQHYRKGIEILQGSRRSVDISQCQIGLAEVARNRGDLDEAEAYYKKALERSASLRDDVMDMIVANLGVTKVFKGEHLEAQAYLSAARERFDRRGRRALSAAVDIAMLCCASAMEDWRTYDQLLQRGQTNLVQQNYVSADVAELVARAGDMAARAGEPERAVAAWQLGVTQYQQLSQPELSARLRMKIDEASTGTVTRTRS